MAKKKSKAAKSKLNFLPRFQNSATIIDGKLRRLGDLTEAERVDYLFTYPNAAVLFEDSILAENDETQDEPTDNDGDK